MLAQPQRKVVELRPRRSNFNPRLRGLVILAVGLALAKWQVFDPLHAREQGAKGVTLYGLLVGLAVFLPVLGASFLTLGSRVHDFIDSLSTDPRRLNWRSAIVLVVVTGVCIAVWSWLLQQLSAQGYH